MDAEKFKAAQEKYTARDFRSAARGFLESTEPGTPIGNGAAYHMAGNAFMRLKRYQDAITVYEHALKDDTYLKRGSVESNLANAYLKSGDYDTAISHYQSALEDSNAAHPYKCYQGMGVALMEQQAYEQAAIAYRRAALDEANPEPGKSLVNLGLCLMALSRPQDAVQAYKAALATKTYNSPGRALSNLGIAYFEMREWARAIQAFEEASTLHHYALSSQAKSLLDQARREFEAAGSREPEAEKQSAVSDIELDEVHKDPAQPTAPFAPVSTGEVTPAPSQSVGDEDIAILAADLAGQSTDAFVPVEQRFDDDIARINTELHSMEIGDEEAVENFFGQTEKEAAKLGKLQAKKERPKHRFLKVFIVLIIVLALLGGAGAAIYYTGFGVPSPKQVVADSLEAYNTGKAFESYWADTTNTVRQMAAVPVPSQYAVESVSVNGLTAEVNVKVTPESSSALAFKFQVVRKGIGWKITSVENEY